MKCHRLCCLKELYFLTVLETGSLTSRCWQGKFLLRPHALTCKWLPTCWILPWPFLWTCSLQMSLFFIKDFCCLLLFIANSCPILHDLMDYSMPGFPVLHRLPEFAQVHVCLISDAIQQSHPLLLTCLQSFPASGFFSNESAVLIRVPKYWSFSFSISPSSEYSVLISFKIDWFDLLAVQGTLKNLLQHHSLIASILWCSAFFMVQLTSVHDYWKEYNLN